ncbi:hypothetical protein BCR35DRAFT_51330 [Leucosporidium creatinivorum]|uniref:RNase III domain-containing protein n=1 Tax=Leucosporidium creatinivorum TaxID=106004 RepID=A0A1Y2BWR2_9BASI|nr:hypothetical protein BCR35DRAFT_51330 [Leucosporidium creatinivorum]
MSPRSALERLLSTTNNAVRPTLCTSSFCTSSSSSARLYSTSNTSNTSTPSTPSTRPPGSRLYSPPTSYLTQHIHQLLAPLNLPTLHDDVIQQALTHKSAVNKARNLTANSEGARAHGERLAFVGEFQVTVL